MSKLPYLGLWILEISKTLMYRLWCNYNKTKYQYDAKLCHMDTGSSIIHIKTKDIAHDLAKRFDTSNYEVNSQWRKIKKLLN